MEIDPTDALASGGSALLGAVTAAVLLRGRLRELLGLDALEARLVAMSSQLDALGGEVRALRAECSGEHETPRARQRASSEALARLQETLARLEGELRGPLTQLVQLLQGHER